MDSSINYVAQGPTRKTHVASISSKGDAATGMRLSVG
jgi:hypothetical protein